MENSFVKTFASVKELKKYVKGIQNGCISPYEFSSRIEKLCEENTIMVEGNEYPWEVLDLLELV